MLSRRQLQVLLDGALVSHKICGKNAEALGPIYGRAISAPKLEELWISLAIPSNEVERLDYWFANERGRWRKVDNVMPYPIAIAEFRATIDSEVFNAIYLLACLIKGF